jgi:diacylglycerol kinase (ATP)
MPPRVKVILNPTAAKGRAKDSGASLKTKLAQYKDVDWFETSHPRHAVDLASVAADEGYSIVAALGGDGTIHEVVNGLMQIPSERRPSLATVPIGSGNDFCNNVGVESDPDLAIERIFDGKTRAIDIGCVSDDLGNVDYWNNTLGIGFDAAAVIHTQKSKLLKGFAMYLWAVIQTIAKDHRSPELVFSFDKMIHQQKALMFTAANGPREGGGFCVAPNASIDDGWFDYTMIDAVSRLMMFRLIPEVMNGTHERFPQIKMGKFRELDIEFEYPLPIHTDGELFAGRKAKYQRIRIEIFPAELTIIT